MNLPDSLVCHLVLENMLVILPTFGVGGIKVNYHGTVTVDTASCCVDVVGFHSTELGCVYSICIVYILVVAIESYSEYTCGVILVHCVCTKVLCAVFEVRTCCVKVKLYALCFRRPYLPSCLGGGIGAT